MLFVVVGLVFSATFALGSVLKLVTAKRLRERRSKTFCLVVAAVSCLGIPYGTALGICTFLVLNRPSVDALFARRATAAL